MVEMSDISRQQKLASAKKKLKKFQQTKSPVNNGPSKENPNLSQEILHGLQTNHIFKTPPLTVSKNEANTNSGNNVKQKLNLSRDSPIPNKVNNELSPSQLFGAPTESKSSNGKFSVANGHSDNESKTRNDSETEQVIASYKRSNLQLSNQVGEQRKQILQFQEKLKEASAVAQKVSNQRALKGQLEVHIQTIGILVSEKSELQSNIASIERKLSNKDTEINELNGALKTAQNRLLDFEKNIHEMKDSKGNLQKTNKDVISERDRISAKLYEVSHQKEELKLQNSEFHSKLQVKINECNTLSTKLNEFHARLQKGESNAQIDESSDSNWKKEKEKILKKIEEQQIIVGRLVADKAELLQKNNDTQSHYEYQIEELKTKMSTMGLERSSLLDQLQSLSESLQNVQQQLSLREASNDEFKNEENNVQTAAQEDHMSIQEELQKIQQEKQSVEQELDIQIQENRRLSRLAVEQTEKIEELETGLSRLQSQSVDKSSLLNQIQSDKETVSRALQQNKILKEQLVELEEGFVKMSNSSAELTTKLETEQHGNKEMAEKYSGVKVELEETKVKLLERTRACDEFSEEVQKFKQELHKSQMKLAAKEMDLDYIETEVEIAKLEIVHQNKGKATHTDDVHTTHRLQEQLRAAEETIQHLNVQNDQLQTALRNMHSKQNVEQTGHRFAQPEGGYSEEDTTTEEEQDVQVDVIQDGSEDVGIIATPRGGAFDDSTTTDDDFDEENAIRVSRDELSHLQKNLLDLQTEREKILQVLQQEREKSFNASEKLEEHVDLKVEQLTVQRERELQEHFYEQTEALQKKVKSLHEALEIMRKNEDIADFDMTSDGITMPLLKTAFMQLQKRYKSAMDSKANLSDRIEQLEHVNMRLESETDSIGEYIALYQSQREAMKDKFAEKDDIIQRISNEHGRMQNKVSQLHQLVMQMLSERSGFESKNKQLQELVNRRLAFQTGERGESEVPKLQYNLDNLFGEITVTPEDESELIKDNLSVTDDEIRRDSINATISDQTAQQILNIFEQLETTGEGYQHGWLSPATRKHSFLPCRNCTGDLLSL